jgi:hypothetical protein
VPDISLDFTGDLDALRETAKESSKLIKKFAKTNEKTFKRIQKIHKVTATEITKKEKIELHKRESLESRLFTRRAKNRLKAFKQRKRDEQRAARETERIAQQTARKVEQAERSSMRRRKRIRQGVARGAGRIGGGIAAAVGVGAIFQAREILTQDEALARASAQANISLDAQMRLKQAILATTLEYGIQRSVITEAASVIVDKSGNIALAAENLGDISKIIRGTGAEARDVGQLYASIANAFKGSGKDLLPTEISDFVEILIAQGDNAQITLADLAGSGEKLFGAFKGAGLRSVKDFISFGALIQTSGESGDPAEAATSAVRVLSEITKKRKQLAKFGVQIFKPGTDEELKDIDVLLKEIISKTGGSVTKLQTIFTERAIKPIKILAAEFKNTGGELKIFEGLINSGATAADNIDRKFNRVAQGSLQGFKQMGALFGLMSDIALTPVLDDLANFFKSIAKDKEALKEIEMTMRGLAKSIQIIAKIAAAPFNITRNVIGAAADIGAENTIRKNTLALAREEARAREINPDFQSSVTKTNLLGGESAIGNVSVNVANNIKTDRFGNITNLDTIIGTQQNEDRGGFNRGAIRQ